MSEPAVYAEIRSALSAHDVVLFMKGTADQPRCGFSNLVVQVLDHLGVEFHAVDVLADDEIRQGIKSFSDWPTVPQLYIKGEFIGGSDIVKEMYQAGELQALLREQGVVADA
jgi:monothiol glutaredoxin